MARDVTLRAVYSDLAGDETYEMWIKRDTDPWVLALTGDVVPVSTHQDFVLLTLTTGVLYVGQIRLKRAGRYRTGYLTGNPDSWPAQSRCEFTPGALEGVGAPSIDSAVWSRTSGSSQKIQLTITPDDVDIDIAVFRDGVQIATVPAPLGGSFTFDDVDPTITTAFEYTAAHIVSGGLTGPLSGPVDCFSGPLPPTAFTLTSDPTNFAFYDVTWSSGSDDVRLQDDFLCDLIFVDQLPGDGTTATETAEINKEDHLSPIDGEQSVSFHARIRREVTAFAVVDASDWVQILITMHIETTNVDFHSCP